MIDYFRIENSSFCGGDGTAHACMWEEDDSIVLTRIAIAESPTSLSDRVYVMWNIKLRAALGFKEARKVPLSQVREDRWGPETDIKIEALCNGGCQYSPARAAEKVYLPCQLSEGNPMRFAFCPTDEQLDDFYWTWTFAEAIMMADIVEDFPPELKGYDGFRSPSVTWIGRVDWRGGRPSQQFFGYGTNIWRDEYPQDNVFWEQVRANIPTPTNTPTRTPTPTMTPTPALTPTVESATLSEAPTEQPIQEETQMELDPGKITLLTSIGVAAVWLLTVIYTQLFKQAKPNEDILKGIVFVASVILAYVWGGAMIPALVLPPIADGLFAYIYVLLEWVTALLALAVLIFKFAQQIFDRLWQPITEWLGKRVNALAFLRP